MSDFHQDLAGLSPDRRELLELLLAKRGMKLADVLVPRGSDCASAPLSFTQERLWASGQLAMGTEFGNLPLAFLVAGALDLQVLKQSATEVVRRHAILRTVYPVVDGRPWQRVLDSFEVVVRHEDLRALAREDRLSEAKRLAEAATLAPINVAEELPLRVLVVRLDEKKHLLLLVTHHLATDGWGARVLLRDLAVFYQSFMEKKSVPLPERTLQYGDFAVWQRDWLRENVLKPQLAYWELQLAGAAPELNLPTDRPRPSRPSLQAASCEFRLSESMSEALRLMSRREGVTLYTTLLAAFKTLLHLYADRDDVVVGSTFSNRPRRETEQMVGNFGNNVLLRTDFSDRPTFRQVMQRVRDVVLDAHAHQDLPLETLIDRNRARGGDPVPLFQVLFILRDSNLEQNFEIPGLTVESIPIEVGMSPFDLSLDMTDGPREIYGFFQYSTDLFDPDTIQSIVDDFRGVLEAVASHPDRYVHDIPWRLDVDRRRAVQASAGSSRGHGGQAQPVNRRAAPRTNGGAPANEIERAIAEVWETVLGISRIGVDEDFMALGGHSLLLVRAALRVEERFGVRLPRSLFMTPTISEFAREVARASREPELEEPGDKLVPVCREPYCRSNTSVFPKEDVFVFPASDSQRQLWFIYQLDRENSSYNVPLAYELAGDVDSRALERSLAEIVRRHETFRTTFASRESEVFQIIHPSVEATLVRIDLASRPDDEALDRVLHEESRKPLDLEKGPLFKFVLLSAEGGRSVLLIVLHHTLVDHTTVRLFAKELSDLYVAFSRGRASPLSEPTLHCSDVSVWQREENQQAVLADKLRYWTEHLKGSPALLELPTDRPRPARQVFRGDEREFRLPTGLSEQLRALSRREKKSLFVTMLAAFKLLLYRYTGQTDITVGCPFANRNRIELEEVMGCLVNTLPLRSTISAADSFSVFLEKVRQVVLGADAHQEVSFESIVEELHPTRDASYNPIFQVFLGLQEPPPLIELAGVDVKFRKPHTGTSKFDLSVWLCEDETGIHGYVEYDLDLFDGETVDQLLCHYQTLLEGIVADPDRLVSRIPLLTDDEKRRILGTWNQTDLDYARGTPVHGLFEEQVERTPEVIAIESDDACLTYRELNRRANQVAHYLRKRGVGPEVLVGICMERSLEMVVGILGILKAGAAYVPLDPRYPRERLSFMLEDAGTLVLLTQKDLVEKLSRDLGEVICLDEDWSLISHESGDDLRSGVTTENLAYVIYTSGSTGRPKGVAIEHASTVALIQWAREVFSPRELSGVLFSTSICFDLSIFELFVPLSWGGSVVLVENILHFLKSPCANKVTLINTVPSGMSALLKAGDLPTCVETVNLAGERLTIEQVRRVYEEPSVRRVYDLFGPTEDTTYSTFALRTPDGPYTVGKPVAGTQVYLLDEYMEPVPIGVVGEMYLAGDGLARGYLNRPELTAERFVANPFCSDPGGRLYRTGDLARYLHDGNIEFLGRTDHQVKIRGFRIELGEIETVLRTHEKIDRVVAVVREDRPDERRLVAYYTGADSTELSDAELIEFLKEHLPNYMIPAALVRLETFPVTPNGKIDRGALPALDEERGKVDSAHVAPRDSLERQLVTLWEKTLGQQPLGVTDDFFTKGGHSILAAQLFAQIEKVLRVNLPLATLFQAPTVEQLAEIVRMADYAPSWSSLVPIQAGGSKPPLYCVHGAGGNVLLYRDLARHLGPDQPVYGLQARGLDGKEPFLTRIEDMASHYIDEIKTVQPDGPYYLGGYCMGGTLAYEMAQQLRERDDEVALLVFFETYNINIRIAKSVTSLPRRLINALQNAAFHLSNLRILDRDGKAAFIREKAKVLRRRVLRQILSPLVKATRKKHLVKSDSSGLTHVRLGKVNDRAQLNYEPKPYSGRTVLFRPNRTFAGFADPDFGWGELIRDNLETQVLPVYPRGMLVEPFVELLSERLKECLDRTQVELFRGGS